MPTWCSGASRMQAMLRGSWVAFSIPGFILFASSSGFGTFARDAGLSLDKALLMMGAFFALPAQVVFTDQLARGGSLVVGAFAVTLIGIRMLPMAVTLVPFLGAERAPRWRVVLAVHAVAVTVWIEGLRRLPHLPVKLRLPYFLGMGTGLIGTSLAGTAVGFVAAATVPPTAAATLLFLTPIYFLLSLLATARSAGDHMAIVAGALFGPIFYVLVPGFDLLATGLVAGTLAFWLGRKGIFGEAGR